MSTLYNLEPPPTAKVILNTTSGDIVLEIFAKQTPLASRNFLQHCLDGYYDNTIFHRLVPGFIIQGGDPTGLGTGGTAAINNGAPFPDEPHNRLRFNRRGLLGMANSGQPDDNTSQFFLTLGSTPELQGKNTMFGRVEGDTIYNLMKMGEADLADEGSDRPLYPTKVTGTEILVNPFEDMEKRIRIAERTKPEVEAPKKGKKRKGGKNLLSFGADEGEEEGPIKVAKKAKVNPQLISAGQESGEMLNNAPMAKAPEEKKEKVVRKKAAASRSPSPAPAMGAGKETPAPIITEKRDPSPSPTPEPAQVTSTMSALEKTNAQIAALKESMKRNTGTAQKSKEKPKSALEAMIPANSIRGRKRGKASDDPGALDMFNAFKAKLGEMSKPASTTNGTTGNMAKQQSSAAEATGGDALDTEEKLCDLHFIANCQSCRSWDEDGNAKGEADDDNDADWMAHSLSFAKDTLGKDLEWKRKMEEFEVIDPREKAQDIKDAKRKEKGGRGGGRDWDKRGGGERDRGDDRRARKPRVQ